MEVTAMEPGAVPGIQTSLSYNPGKEKLKIAVLSGRNLPEEAAEPGAGDSDGMGGRGAGRRVD